MLTADELKKIPKPGSSAALLRRRSYFDGKNSVAELEKLRLDGRVKSKNNRNWFRYAAKMHAGFLCSREIAYSVRGENVDPGPVERLRAVYDDNGLRASDLCLMLEAIAYGFGAEVYAFDGKRHVFTKTNPWEWTLIEDEAGELIYAVRLFCVQPHTYFEGSVVDKKRDIYFVYSKMESAQFEANEDGKIVALGDPMSHTLGMVPVNIFRATDDGMSFFSDAFLKQCDSYDITRSALMDDIISNVDSLLAMENVDLAQLLEPDEEGVTVFAKMIGMGIFAHPKDTTVSYLQRVVAIEKFIADLKETRSAIHMMAALPDLDETINGNAGTITSISGVALKLMYQPMTQQGSEFGSIFEMGLRRRVEMMNRTDSIRGLAPLSGYDITYQQNLPHNDVEIVQYMPSLAGVLATKDKIKLLAFVRDPEAAYRNLIEEQKNAAKPVDKPASGQSEGI